MADLGNKTLQTANYALISDVFGGTGEAAEKAEKVKKPKETTARQSLEELQASLAKLPGSSLFLCGPLSLYRSVAEKFVMRHSSPANVPWKYVWTCCQCPYTPQVALRCLRARNLLRGSPNAPTNIRYASFGMSAAGTRRRNEPFVPTGASPLSEAGPQDDRTVHSIVEGRMTCRLGARPIQLIAQNLIACVQVACVCRPTICKISSPQVQYYTTMHAKLRKMPRRLAPKAKVLPSRRRRLVNTTPQPCAFGLAHLNIDYIM